MPLRGRELPQVDELSPQPRGPAGGRGCFSHVELSGNKLWGALLSSASSVPRRAESQDSPALFWFLFFLFVGGFRLSVSSLTEEKLLLGQRADGCPPRAGLPMNVRLKSPAEGQPRAGHGLQTVGLA